MAHTVRPRYPFCSQLNRLSDSTRFSVVHCSPTGFCPSSSTKCVPSVELRHTAQIPSRSTKCVSKTQEAHVTQILPRSPECDHSAKSSHFAQIPPRPELQSPTTFTKLRSSSQVISHYLSCIHALHLVHKGHDTSFCAHGLTRLSDTATILVPDRRSLKSCRTIFQLVSRPRSLSTKEVLQVRDGAFHKRQQSRADLNRHGP